MLSVSPHILAASPFSQLPSISDTSQSLDTQFFYPSIHPFIHSKGTHPPCSVFGAVGYTGWSLRPYVPRLSVGDAVPR